MPAHLASASEHFARAEGARGLVMEVGTLPTLDVVLKLIEDRCGEPKRTTRREVMERYHFVVVHDRVGRLAVRGGPLRDAFLAHHADLLTRAWWETTQAR